jgi:hypothetical protein
MQYKEIITAYFENHIKHTHRWQSANFLMLKQMIKKGKAVTVTGCGCP